MDLNCGHASRIRLIRTALFGVVFLSSALFGAVPQESNFDLEGSISKQAAGKLTVDSGQGIYFRVTYDDKTPIVGGDGRAGSEKDLKLGIKVHVVGDLQSSGEIKAQRIEIESDAPKKSPTSQSSF